MKILFVHQNMPGQFARLARHLAADRTNEVMFVTKRRDLDLPGIRHLSYRLEPQQTQDTHPYARVFDDAVRHGQRVAGAGEILKRDGFQPDIVIAHPGWGEALYLKDVFPETPLITYCEYYYDGHGADLRFDPGDPPGLDLVLLNRSRNAHLLLSLESSDAGISPTAWQKMQYPPLLQSRIQVIPDGIDLGLVRPNAAARFVLPGGRVLTATDEVVTFVARNLEPYRGFDQFMKALPEVLAARPAAQIVVVGGDGVSYGDPPPGGGGWREYLLRSLPIDLARVHFPGLVPYPSYLALLQLSSVHVYLTRPFVLSWSCTEAMAAGCLLVASATPPVTEVIEDGVNGLLVDFHAPDQIAARTIEALTAPQLHAEIRRNARRTAEARFALDDAISRQVGLIASLVG